MKLIWTRSKLPLSVLIRWFLNSDCSHFAIVFKSRDGGLMFESNLLGTHPKFFKTALKHMTVVHEIELDMTDDEENAAWDMIVDQVDGLGYNYRGFAYFTYRAFLKKLFRIPLPPSNPWSQSGTYLCEQVLASVAGPLHISISADLSMLSPEDHFHLTQAWISRGVV